MGASHRRKLSVAGLVPVPESPCPMAHVEQVPLIESFISRARAAMGVGATDEEIRVALMRGQSPQCDGLVALAVAAAKILEKASG